MKINEIIDPSIEEGWKEKLAALGVAGVLGVGSAAYNKISTPAKPNGTLSPSSTIAPAGASGNKLPAAKHHITSEINLKKLATVLPGPAKVLQNHAIKSGIKGEELLQFLAQAAHETSNFTKLEEIGNKNYFKNYDPKYNPALAKRLGNTKPGDGEKYKGRGFLQITGRWNYRIAGEDLGLPLEQKPELLNNPDVAAKVSIWYWNKFVKPKVNNFSDVRAVTKRINPGLRGLEDRVTKYQNFVTIAKL